MKKAISKHLSLRLQDWSTKTDIRGALKFLRTSQFWDEDRVRDYQSEKLLLLVTHAYKNIPYYRETFDKVKLKPQDIKSIDDIVKIPILTKEIVQSRGQELIDQRLDLKNIKSGKTGGTTGAPLKFYKDSQNRSFTWGSYYRWYDWMGVHYSDAELTFWGQAGLVTSNQNKNLRQIGIDFVQNKKLINSFNLSKSEMPRIYKEVMNFNPVILKGYLSSLIDFADFIDTNDLPPPRPKAVSSTTETLHPNNRAFLERVFKAPVFDQYGCGELSGMAYECSEHNGLHINQEHMYCEVLDPVGNAVQNLKGRLIGTDLDNFFMPFIRYENGDVAEISPATDCPCGVRQPKIKSISGRSIDTVQLKDGSNVHGVFFTTILYELGILTDQIQRFQIKQFRAGSIEMNIQTKKVNSDLSSKIHRALEPYMDSTVILINAPFEYDKSGKFRYILNKKKSK